MDLLLRDIPLDLKKKLAVQAASNGRSQSAEALAILEDALKAPQKEWWQILRESAQEEGAAEYWLERPTWASTREFAFDEG